MAYSRTSRGSLQEVTRVRTDGSSTNSGGRRDDLEAMVAKGAKKSSAYEKYKQQLHSFFDGDTPLPENLKEMLSTRPGAEDHGLADEEGEAPKAKSAPKRAPKKAADAKEKGARSKGARSSQSDGTKRRRLVSGPGSDYQEHVDAMRRAQSPREVIAAIDALKGSKHPLPDDVELLSKALSHSDDAILEEALRGMIAAEIGPEAKSAGLLKTRLKNVALVTGSSEVRSLCSDVENALSGAA